MSCSLASQGRVALAVQAAETASPGDGVGYIPHSSHFTMSRELRMCQNCNFFFSPLRIINSHFRLIYPNPKHPSNKFKICAQMLRYCKHLCHMLLKIHHPNFFDQFHPQHCSNGKHLSPLHWGESSKRHQFKEINKQRIILRKQQPLWQCSASRE